MDNIVPHREVAAPISVRRVESAPQLPLAAISGTESLEQAKVVFSPRQHVIIVGATLESLRAVSDQLRSSGHAGPEHVLFDSHLSGSQWSAELEAKLNSVVAKSWRAREVSIALVRDGFSSEQLSAVLGGLQFIPRAVYLVSSGSSKESASVHSLQQPKFGALQRSIKRGADILGGCALLFFLLPLMLFIGLLIKLDSPGPVLFRQKRLGFLGKPFDIYKFRTMTVQENGDTVVQARREDPRVTRIGRILRRSSMDELPQLLNVVKGEMSLVGPRPHAEAHDRQYSAIVPRYSFRSYVKPGMTGWAQVHGYRGQIKSLDDITKRVEFDSWYARNATVLLDLKILLRTVSIVINQKNAY
jgi:undecaprenyl-phosphate galactose phosphotransferase/putative colanic acid biosynthesis UDP-glucose lipid carrier transferase